MRQLPMPDHVVEVHSSPNAEDVIGVVDEASRRMGLDTYLVGGFVRDRLLGVPGKDVDLVTVGAEGVPLLAGVAKHFGWAPPQRFERFGTGQIRGDGFVLEVVRARSERYDPESRKPDVRPGTLEDDVWRRDFTVNALAQTLNGRIIDVTQRGLDDLRSGVLRTPLDPAETFSEDPLRRFRGARFVAQLGFTLADGILPAMREQAHRASILSTERVRDEIRRLLVSQYPSRGLRVLHESGLLGQVMPELEEMIGVEQGGYHLWDVFEHTIRAVELAPPDLITRTATLLHDVGKPRTHEVAADGRHTFYGHAEAGADMARDMLTRLRFSNDEVDAIALLVRLHLRPIQYEHETFSDAAVRRLIVAAGEWRAEMLDVARADTNASAFPTTSLIDELGQRMAELDAGSRLSRMEDPITGDEIMQMAGRSPGPWVGRVKQAIRDAILDGTIPSNDEPRAREWLQQHRDLLSAE
jgi:putative nucleotidyltransferase with HDIG domain